MTSEIENIVEDLKEVRRYVRTHIQHTEDEILRIDMALGIEQAVAHAVTEKADLAAKIDRIRSNINIGVKHILSSPSTLEGYIDGAVFELQLK